MSLSIIIEDTLQVFKKNQKVIIFYAIISGILSIINNSIIQYLNDIYLMQNELITYFIMVFLSGGIYFFTTLFISCIFLKHLYNFIDESPEKFKSILNFIKQKFFFVITTSFLAIFIIIIGYILLIIPGIILSIYLIFSTYAALFRDKKNISAIKYSINLVKGNWFRVLGYIILANIIIGGLNMIVSDVFSIMPNLNISLIFNLFEQIITFYISSLLMIYILGFFLILEEEKKENQNEEKKLNNQ